MQTSVYLNQSIAPAVEKEEKNGRGYFQRIER